MKLDTGQRVWVHINDGKGVPALGVVASLDCPDKGYVCVRLTGCWPSEVTDATGQVVLRRRFDTIDVEVPAWACVVVDEARK